MRQGNRGREIRNRDVRQGIKCGKQGTERRHRALDKGREKGDRGTDDREKRSIKNIDCPLLGRYGIL